MRGTIELESPYTFLTAHMYMYIQLTSSGLEASIARQGKMPQGTLQDSHTHTHTHTHTYAERQNVRSTMVVDILKCKFKDSGEVKCLFIHWYTISSNTSPLATGYCVLLTYLTLDVPVTNNGTGYVSGLNNHLHFLSYGQCGGYLLLHSQPQPISTPYKLQRVVILH